MSDIEAAIALALEAHGGQHQKDGSPYILHPLTLMTRVHGHIAQMAAVLHDVVEDTPFTLDELRERGFSKEVVAVVDALTHRDGETYEQYIERVRQNPIAVHVKLADLEHNMDVRRLPSVTAHDTARMERYRRTWALLVAG